jgi:signal transduction histidine kinase
MTSSHSEPRLELRDLAVLAHELRHPLAPMRNAVEIMKRLEGHEPRVERAVGILDRQLRVLTGLIDRLFDSAQLANQSPALCIECLDLAEVLDQALEVCQPPLQRHYVTVTRPEEPVWVQGDRLRLLQVFTNLLDNAAKYSDGSGPIEVVLGVEADTAWVRVRDQGRGITADDLPHLFKPFVQANTGNPAMGLGIGLALVKRLVEAHGGHVEAHSAGLGQGSTFTVTLPRSRPMDLAI